MNLLSPTVLGAAGVCTSPALYQTLVTGGVPLEVAMTRYLVALVLCWVAISLVAALVGEPPAPAARATDPGDPAPVPDVERPPGVPAE
ncbi:unannotated protein [freshwater metagenome]|jgi:hypothetical protein|uniref:Unannotated protein n=1 Tax=freshwater metagenome TaxID=449393 RepID=A0A6J6VRX4_9ZZZZ|nr:hypothetical protein [Actinomycetota bacterium]